MAAPFYIPTNSVKGSLYGILSPASIICSLSDDGHSDWCEVIPHGGFDLHFSNNERCRTPFHVTTVFKSSCMPFAYSSLAQREPLNA